MALQRLRIVRDLFEMRVDPIVKAFWRLSAGCFPVFEVYNVLFISVDDIQIIYNHSRVMEYQFLFFSKK